MYAIVRSLSFALLSACLAWAGGSAAQNYPTRSVRIIIPSAAGGPTDVLTRVLGQKMAEAWGQQVIPDNRVGGSSIIGAMATVKAPNDGYTIMMALDSTLALNPSMFAKLPYDPLVDFAPITRTAFSPIVLIVDAAGPKSVRELIQKARANPGKLNFGTGTPPTRLAGEMIKSMAGIDMLNVPFKGSAGTVQGLLSRDVDFTLDGVTTAMPHIRSGKFRVLASLSSYPIDALPGTPALASEPEFAGFDVSVWLGLVAPAGTPPDIVNKLQRDTVRIMALPDVKERMANIGLIPAGNTPEEFRAFIRSEGERWAKVIKQAGIKPE
ncbi:MAG: tripartite tricarboxylate transporter substrate binding protein [Betaproteobacteria bacterium]|nr:tripartite tricarboxylate transporter substrate binding protein [Betaproteobacteria bacterium]